MKVKHNRMNGTKNKGTSQRFLFIIMNLSREKWTESILSANM